MKCYFHIGQAKTGTSAIQSFMNLNRELLTTKYKILYPNFESNNMTGSGGNHNHVDFFNQININEHNERITKIAECLEFAQKNGIEKIVFSAEQFGLAWLPVVLADVTTTFNLDYNIILYLRRQDHYLEAAWKQWGHKIKKISSIQEYANILQLDWYAESVNWLKHIGPEKFIVRPYEISQIGRDIIVDFMALIGVTNLTDFAKPEDNSLNANHGLNNDVIEILRLCKKQTGRVHSNLFLDYVHNTLSDQYKKKPMAGYNILSPEERLKIIEKYTESNNGLAEIFFGKGAVLFHDPLPDINEPWEKNTGLTFENTVPILMELLYRQNLDIHHFQKKNNEMQDNLKNQLQLFIQKSLGIRKHFHIANDMLFQKSGFNRQITDKQLVDGDIQFRSVHNDPIIYLPKTTDLYNNPVINLEITVPQDTVVQVFYKTSSFSRYKEEQCVSVGVPAGRHSIEFNIHAQKVVGRLRLDPGNRPGLYRIHHVEFVC